MSNEPTTTRIEFGIELPVLYHQGKKGDIYSWRVFTENDNLVTEYGLVDGEKQVAPKACEGKNIGRSNETTPEKQAQLEAIALWKNKRDRKYAESIEEASEELIRPMLASDFEKRKGKKKNGVSYPAYTQPKLDGVRALAYYDGDHWEVISRSGKSWIEQGQGSVAHIVEALESFAEENPEIMRFAIDGEIYAHGESFQQTTRLVKKFRPGAEGSRQLVFHVYDLIDRDDDMGIVGFGSRLQNLFWFRDRLTPNSSIEIVPTGLALDEEEVYKHQMMYLANGYEGAMVRLEDGPYQWGARSYHLLKVKTFQDAEYKIVGVNDGDGKFEGAAIFLCATDHEEHQLFRVTPQGTMEERREMFTNGLDYIGQQLKVRFFETTEAGIPRFPIGVGVRLPEDMESTT